MQEEKAERHIPTEKKTERSDQRHTHTHRGGKVLEVGGVGRRGGQQAMLEEKAERHIPTEKKTGGCLVTGNFGLFTEIPVCKFLRGWRAYRPKPSLFFLFLFL